jgi:hypothetical protein
MSNRTFFGRVVGWTLAAAALAAFASACSSPAPADNPIPDLRDDDAGIDDTKKPPKQQQENPPPPDQVTPACTDTCALEDERRCKAGAPGSCEACLRGENGCLSWVESTCVDKKTCDPNARQSCVGLCPPQGRAACEQIGTKRCTGTKLETCEVESGCPVWKESQDCAAQNKICDGTACVTQCTSNCTTAGARRCVAGTNNYETCAEVQPGCLRWQATKSCGSGKVCTGAGVCACNDECTTVGQNQCVSPTTFKTCTTNAAGCKVWTAQKNCVRSVPSPGCFAYGKACFGQCNDTCTTEGQITCTGPSSYVRCTRNSEQCLAVTSGNCKSASTICFSNPTQCVFGP